mgnify:CR=1 FL=1|jgi:hypothetical protein
MLLGVELDIWRALVALLVVPLAVVGLLNLLLRRRGGVGLTWGGVLFVMMAAVVAVIVILQKVQA